MAKRKKTQTQSVKKADSNERSVPPRIEDMDDVKAQAPVSPQNEPQTDSDHKQDNKPKMEVSTKPVAENTQDEVQKALQEMREAQQRMAEQEARLAEKERQLDEKLKAGVQNLTPMDAATRAAAEVHHETRVERMKKNLAKQEIKSIMIPLGPKEKVGTTLPVILDGYRLNIPKGEYIDVPMQVAKVVADSQNQTIRAGQNMRLDSDNTPDALL